MKYISSFDTNKNYGEKGNNLKILYNAFKNDAKIKIPKTIVLNQALFKKVIFENGETDFAQYQNILINPNLTEMILSAVHKEFPGAKLVIRSSASCEDSIFFSGAGQYDSFLNIKEDEDILNAIKKIYSSFYRPNSVLYSKIYGIDLTKETMSILIQEVAPVVTAGVMFSCDPVNGNKKYIIESSKGLGTSVVEGVGNITNLEIDYSKEDYQQDEKIKILIYALKKIKETFNYDVDVEWGLDKENNLYLFQARPIIFNKNNYEFEHVVGDFDKQDCDVVSKGLSVGKICNISSKNQNVILFQDIKYDFNDLELLLDCKGVLLKEKSKLSHFANILRELNKPCLTVGDYKFKEDNLYLIDAYKGKIIDFNSLNPNIKVYYLIKYFKYLEQIYKSSFEAYNGILNIEVSNKTEQVVFGINESEILNKLKENNFSKKVVNQSIYTYDLKDRSLILGNGILRIQVANGQINIQLKKLNNSEFKDYRQEENILLYFKSLEKAKKFMSSLNMVETGYQERKIIKYEKDNVTVNIIKWPGCQPYLGIEVADPKDLSNVHKVLNILNCEFSGMGGKEIFEKLNLELKECKF